MIDTVLVLYLVCMTDRHKVQVRTNKQLGNADMTKVKFESVGYIPNRL